MRLLRQVERLEAAAAAAAREAEPGRIGIAWTTAEERLEARDLGPGEYIACDVTIAGDHSGAEEWRIRERVTYDLRDLGHVYNADGERVGRVVAMEGTLITWHPIEN